MREPMKKHIDQFEKILILMGADRVASGFLRIGGELMLSILMVEVEAEGKNKFVFVDIDQEKDIDQELLRAAEEIYAKNFL